MTGLIAPPDNIEPEDAVVVADGWFPDVKLADVRAAVRLGDGVVTTARLIAAIEGAMLSAFRALAQWRAARILAGAATFDQVTDLQIGGRSQAVVLWHRIIRNYAAAELADLHADISATGDGFDRAEDKRLTSDDYRRLAYAAVADLLSIGASVPVPRNRVSLV